MGYTEVRMVRHAEASHVLHPDIVAGQAPYSVLTEDGVRQARQLGMSWKKEAFKPDFAHTSPLIRALNTLQIAQMAGGLPLVTDVYPELAEQSLGYHEGRRRSDVYDEYTRWMIELQGALYRHQGRNEVGVPGESMADIPKRMLGYFAMLRDADNDSKTGVAMTHHITMKSTFSYLELGGLEGPVDPHELHALTLSRAAIPVCGQALVIVEGGPAVENLKVQVEHAYLSAVNQQDNT